MSSYRGTGGAWDGGPPGAEAEYAGQPPPLAYPTQAAASALPATDPWTGVSYSQYGAPPNYDYQAYANYGYNYDSSYYTRQEGNYYKYSDSRSTYPPAPSGYEYPPRPRERSRSPVDSRSYDRRRRSYSRSVSPYEKKERGYSKMRDSSYEGSRRARSRSKSKSKRTKYSSSDRSSSRSRSYSRSRMEKKKKGSVSSESSTSDRSYKKGKHGVRDSLTSGKKKRSRSLSHRTPSPKKSSNRSPKSNTEKEAMKNKDVKPHSSKETKGEDKRVREVKTPPHKKRSESVTSKRHKNLDRGSITPPKSYKRTERSVTPPKSYKSQGSIKKKHRDSSVTPPKSYARSRSSSSSRSPSPRHSKRKRSNSPKTHRSRSRSYSRSPATPCRSRSKSRRRTRRKSDSKQRSKSRSRRRSLSKSRSKSRRRSRSKGKKRSTSRSKSRSKSRSSHSRSGTPSEDERRGQFTVADRKRFWKLHKSRQEDRQRDKTPPIEVKRPPGALNTQFDDIEYGDPPEVEGPNFAELLPTADQVLINTASTSKSKNIPLPIKNDGSFLEMFKKMQEETKKIEEIEKKPEIKKPLPFIGKRRGGRVLKTGMVKKAKAIDEQNVDNTPKDAWSLYMQEVKKYRETSCEEERKTRPLVK